MSVTPYQIFTIVRLDVICDTLFLTIVRWDVVTPYPVMLCYFLTIVRLDVVHICDSASNVFDFESIDDEFLDGAFKTGSDA